VPAEFNEFQLTRGWAIGLRKARKKRWEVALISPDRRRVVPLGLHPDGFWAEWHEKDRFVNRIAGELQAPVAEVKEALKNAYSELCIRGLKAPPEPGATREEPGPAAYRCECGNEFVSVGPPPACPKCGGGKVRRITDEELAEEEEVRLLLQNPQEFEAVTREMTPEELDGVLGLTIKRDSTNKRIHFLVGVLTYTEDDQANISNRSPSATGKSYIPIEITTRYFPKSDVLLIAYASPTSFFHEAGEWDEERKVYRVNLERKILIFLDQPHDELLRRLRPLLSHDQKELVVKITDKRERKGLRTKTVEVRGFPTVFFCTGSLKVDEQEATRSFVLSPETTEEKLREAIYLKALRKGNPLEYARMVESSVDRERLRKRVLLIKHSGIKNIVLENPGEVAERFMREFPRLKPRHTRDVERVISLAKGFALLNLWHRRREGDTLYVDRKDIDNAFELYREVAESQELGIPPYVYRVFREVIEPLYREKNDGGGDGNTRGLTRQEIIRKHFEVYGRPLPDWQLRLELLPALESVGLVYQDSDPVDKRKKLIYVASPTLRLTISDTSRGKEGNSECGGGGNTANTGEGEGEGRRNSECGGGVEEGGPTPSPSGPTHRLVVREKFWTPTYPPLKDLLGERWLEPGEVIEAPGEKAEELLSKWSRCFAPAPEGGKKVPPSEEGDGRQSGDSDNSGNKPSEENRLFWELVRQKAPGSGKLVEKRWLREELAKRGIGPDRAEEIMEREERAGRLVDRGSCVEPLWFGGEGG
jgi:hypothetical protein